jgi:radical SAM superfamily enzyme YgiQ (UPF0313 family)
MRIMLVVPTMGYTRPPLPLLSFSDFPSGLGYIAAALKAAGHEVIGVNPNNDNRYDKPYYMLLNKLSEAIESGKPDLIGLGGLCIDYAFLKDAIDLCRQLAPKTPIVLGGGIVNNDAEFIFNLLKPDYAIQGDGEEAMVLLAHGGKPHNLWYWEDGKPQYTGQDYEYGNVDDRPFPDYTPFGVQEMVDKYSCATRALYRYTRPEPRPFTIVTARGCPFNCSFCVHRGGPKYRARSIANIMAEIKENYEKYQFNILLILDELFVVNKQRFKDFCDALLANKELYGWDFDWTFQTHASAKLDLEVLQLAKKAGCFFFSYGLESASPTVLKSMDKRIKIPQIIEAMDLAHQTGIGFGGNLIFGDIAETQTTLLESLKFYYDYCSMDEVFLGFLMPYPGNKLFDTCMERGLIKDKAEYYANIDKEMYNMTTMPNEMWSYWMNYLILAERSWLTIKSTNATSVVKEDTVDAVTISTHNSRYRIEANCPYCGEHLVYREVVYAGKVDSPVFIGTGCQRCNKRIRVEFKLPEAVCELPPVSNHQDSVLAEK